MDVFLAMLGALAFGTVIFLMQGNRQSKGKQVAEKFSRLGNLIGKTEKQITLFVGPPNSISNFDDGRKVLQWLFDGYHIALIFKNGICKGISHETNVQN